MSPDYSPEVWCEAKRGVIAAERCLQAQAEGCMCGRAVPQGVARALAEVREAPGQGQGPRLRRLRLA